MGGGGGTSTTDEIDSLGDLEAAEWTRRARAEDRLRTELRIVQKRGHLPFDETITEHVDEVTVLQRGSEDT